MDPIIKLVYIKQLTDKYILIRWPSGSEIKKVEQFRKQYGVKGK